MKYSTTYHSPLGEIRLIATEDALTDLLFQNQIYQPSICKEEILEKKDLPLFIHSINWLDQYFNRQQPAIQALPLAPVGSAFRRAVWQILCAIPYGTVITYGEIAQAIARQRGLERMSAQAVGGAVGHNPIPIIIPCHRVVGAKGNLTGYGGGIDKKIHLLAHEGLDMKVFHVPKKGTAL